MEEKREVSLRDKAPACDFQYKSLIIVREYWSTECRLRFSTEIYGNKQENIVFHKNLKTLLFVTEVSGNFRDFAGTCNLGILYSSSLLIQAIAQESGHDMTSYIIDIVCSVFGPAYFM